MKHFISFSFFIFLGFSLALFGQDREYYQFKIYTLASEAQVAMTDAYLRDAYLPALKRTGINNIGVFKPKTIETDSVKKIYILIPYTSLDQFLATDEAVFMDDLHNAVGASYIQASYDNPPFLRKESILMRAFSHMPTMQPSRLTNARKDRVYELRSYESATEALYQSKVHMFNEGGEVALFDQLGFNAVFYAEVLSGANMPNLMYMTTFKDQESRDAHWKSFSESPVWDALKVKPEYQHTVSRNDTRFLYPTEYSDY